MDVFPMYVKMRIWTGWLLAALFVISIIVLQGVTRSWLASILFLSFILISAGVQRPRIGRSLEWILSKFWIWAVCVVALINAHYFSFLSKYGGELLFASTLGFIGIWIYRDIYFLHSRSLKSDKKEEVLRPPPLSNIDPILRKTCTDFGVPALGIAVTNGAARLDWVAVTGKRRVGANELVTSADKFHIGSCGKSMTATLAAFLVDQGLLKWKLTLGEFFTGIKIHPQYASVTLEQLLCHRGGVPDDLSPDGLWASLWQQIGTPTEQRAYLAERILSKPPVRRPGSEHLYSNAGYTIAGALMEQLVKEPWEKCMESRLFRPLGMTSAGFGPPAKPGELAQPIGHRSGSGNVSIPVEPGIKADNPVSLAPAGRIHCSLTDWCRYAAFHLSGKSSSGALCLSPDTLRKLHTPGCDPNYAFGWAVTKRPWAHGDALTHGGSNTMFYAVIWLAPKRDFAAMAVTNKGGSEGFDACDRMISSVIHG